jgi:pimeloyl-ACP methyl ester carboxylesterase
MGFFRKLTLVCILGLCAPQAILVWAGPTPPELPKPVVEEISIPSQINPRLTIKGIRYIPKNADMPGPKPKPLVLFHGLMSTTYHFKDLGQTLAGYGDEKASASRQDLLRLNQEKTNQLRGKITAQLSDPELKEIEAEISVLETESLALQAIEAGREVYLFNFRGHGIGSQLSSVSYPQPTDYSLRNMITEDVPTAVEYVYARTGSQVILGGHSTGAMITSKYSDGVVLDHENLVEAPAFPYGTAHVDQPALTEGNLPKLRRAGKVVRVPALAYNPAVQADRANKVAGLVLIGGPYNFDETSIGLKALAKAMLTAHRVVPKTLDLKISEGFTPVPNPVWSMIDPFAFTFLPGHVVNNDNLTRSESAGIRKKGVSAPHKELLLDFAHWIHSGKWEDPFTGFSYSTLNPNNKIPRLNITGELDGLAPHKGIAQAMLQRPAGVSIRTVIIQNTSHLDLIIGKHAAFYTYPVIEKFASNPDLIGPVGSVTQVGYCRPGSGRGILTGVLRVLGRGAH